MMMCRIGHIWWLKLAPSMYETLEGSYHFRAHDPETEGYVMMQPSGGFQCYFTLAPAKLCPAGHCPEVRGGGSFVGGGFTHLKCSECQKSYKQNITYFQCDKCSYILCLWCGSELDHSLYPPPPPSSSDNPSATISGQNRAFVTGDRVRLRPVNAFNFGNSGPVWCLGRPEQRLVGEIVGSDSNQGSLSVRCNDVASPSPGTFLYASTQLELAP